jgi:hypothetical protein
LFWFIVNHLLLFLFVCVIRNGKSGLFGSELGDFFDILPLAGGDKPRHYKRSFTEQVGAGFIPA